MKDTAEMRAVITTAIENQQRLKVKLPGDDFDMDFDPYIFGHDLMQHDFVWGYLTHNALMYKFRLTDFADVKLTRKKFDVIHAAYYYSTEEEHYAIASGVSHRKEIYAYGHSKEQP